MQNPHDPEATYAVKGQGQQKKEHVGYKVQVAESVSEAVLEPGEPTRNFIVGMVTQAAHESDELGAEKMEQEQAAMAWPSRRCSMWTGRMCQFRSPKTPC